MTRVKKGVEFSGNIIGIRSIEDCIRETKKYTEGIWTRKRDHPIQGEEFPSAVFCKYYEVYPDMEVGWDMSVTDFFDWLRQATPCIDVMFHYDYPVNKASMVIKDGGGAVNKLTESIPGFGDAVKDVNGIGKNSEV